MGIPIPVRRRPYMKQTPGFQLPYFVFRIKTLIRGRWWYVGYKPSVVSTVNLYIPTTCNLSNFLRYNLFSSLIRKRTVSYAICIANRSPCIKQMPVEYIHLATATGAFIVYQWHVHKAPCIHSLLIYCDVKVVGHTISQYETVANSDVIIMTWWRHQMETFSA